jgi:hypothetical protein
MPPTNDLEQELAEMTLASDAVKQALDPVFASASLPLGYALFVFPAEPGPGFARYVTNVDVDVMAPAVLELVSRIEANDVALDGGPDGES